MIGALRLARLGILCAMKVMAAHTAPQLLRILVTHGKTMAAAVAVAAMAAERVAEAALLDLETAAGMRGGAAALCAMRSYMAGPVSGKVATAGRTKQETTRATTEAVTGRDATRGN